MSRVLFLDDNPARQRWAARTFGPGNVLVQATTAAGAVAELAAGPFDCAYLDHDLGDEAFVDSSRPDCGMEVVRWVEANRPAVGEFVAHTMNTPAGHEMVRRLRLAGYGAKYRSFYRMAYSDTEAPR